MYFTHGFYNPATGDNLHPNVAGRPDPRFTRIQWMEANGKADTATVSAALTRRYRNNWQTSPSCTLGLFANDNTTYGRDWRQGVYMDVGGQDAKDAGMAADYLRTLGYVDMDRVGVWGLSYGRFFTLIAMTDQPTLFRAGVNIAGVVDDGMYYEDPYHGGWTRSRIGTPQENPEVCRRASPLSNMSRLERPLLTLHGTADVNVPYLHSVRLGDELLRQGKGELTTFMLSPGEFHYFTRAHVLRDAWTRVAAFFEAHLRQGRIATEAPGP